MPAAPRALADLLAGLPPEPNAHALWPTLQSALARAPAPVVAVDDDPTGVQTVHDTPVLLAWPPSTLHQTLTGPHRALFLLTNSRSLPEPAAEELNHSVGEALTRAAPHPLAVVSRSDSTLRGHYPAELLALAAGLGEPFDGHLLVPAFFEGGRFTIDDTHWVATPSAQSPTVIPASETSFAQDPVFGFQSAHLPTWVAEKSRGRWSAADVRSIPLATVRAGPAAVAAALAEVRGGLPVVVNAAGYGDLTAFVIGLLQAEARGQRFLYRTAASFVRIRAGLPARPLLTTAEIYTACGTPPSARPAGLVVVGSYQPATSEQVAELQAAADLDPVLLELPVADVLRPGWSPAPLAAAIDAALERGAMPILATSRTLHQRPDLDPFVVGQRVMDALVEILRTSRVRPEFVIAKGGITSHEVARRGLGAAQALALGQLWPGVPVWKLEAGPELRWAGTPYVVVPGNVGGPDTLVAAVRALRAPGQA